MKRASFSLAALLFGNVTTMASLVLSFGCCALPIHGTSHGMAPACAMRKGVPSGTNHRPAIAPRVEERLVRAPAVETSVVRRAGNEADQTRVLTLPRNRVAQGALRCDDDIGLSTLLATFII